MHALVAGLPALEGFFTIGVLIGLGWVLARAGVLTTEHRRLMSNLALLVASPALLFTTMLDADLSRVFDRSVIASNGSIVAVAVISVVATV
ncbi:MAG: AEC family transporter, partial [Propionibacteriaceae bacterium]|nr:AEC family transporter [Propionibacteriaceae bacterium]